MAMREHFEMVKQGTDVWNVWRKKHPKVRPSLRGATLRGTTLRSADLSCVDLRRVDLSDANLSDADLSNAKFISATLRGIDLSDADLSGADLSWANLSEATLKGADLSGASLSHANLSDANLSGATFSGADLREADLSDANLSGTDLSFANLSHANLIFADLSRANLLGANLFRANLLRADLSHTNFNDANLNDANLDSTNLDSANLNDANLDSTNLDSANLDSATFIGANLDSARTWNTIFGDIDLRQVKGLERVKHAGPSTVGIDTLVRSEGNIPEAFLRGAGVPDSVIEYARSLVANPIEYYTCFISYSGQDEDFARRIYADLQSNNVRCWFAPEDMKIGDKIRPRIDESIRLYDKLLVILSDSSVKSQWVEHEVETAMGKELEDVPNVLFPVRLDNAILESKAGWASHIRLTRHIGDFTSWKDHDEYQKSFQRLLRDLQARDIPKSE